MLSRVAETIYWLGRYVERAENVARILRVNAQLTLDTPKGVAPAWEALIYITGQKDEFYSRCDTASERNVVKFLIGLTHNPGSILASLSMARENARTVRETLPTAVWEAINELHWYALDNAKSGATKKGHAEYLDRVISGSQRLVGVLSSVMYRDEAYHFLRIGRNLERADMTSRILDVRSTDLFDEDQIETHTLDALQWISVLKSLSGYQSYRRICATRIKRAEVLGFLLQDPAFPRSVVHTLDAVEESIGNIGHGAPVMQHVRGVGQRVRALKPERLGRQELHTTYDDIQKGVRLVHDELAMTYFLLQRDNSQSGASQSQG
ncbi:MAG: alpha-E domain-containing protein [bacterium]